MTPSIDLGTHIINPDALSSKMRKNENYILWHLSDSTPAGEFPIAENPDPNDMNLIITTDYNGINAGSFLIRRCNWTEMFLDLWVEPMYVDRDWIAQEQDALVHMLAHHRFVSDHVALVHQSVMNSYATERYVDELWQEGDLVVHFAGCG